MGKIEIEHFIVHVLDNQTPKIVLSDAECPILPEIQNLLLNYIKYSLKTVRKRVGRFKQPANLVENASILMLKNPQINFIDQSQKIAEHLYTIMAADKRISRGDLLVCTYSEEDSDFSMVAIFKVDLTTAFFRNVTQSAGKTSITIQPRTDAFPPPGDLQKCVFVQPMEPEKARKDYDLTILDNQISAIEDRPGIANFFCRTFLDCELALTDKRRAILFGKFTEKWLEKKEKEGVLAPDEVMTMKKFLRQAFKSDVINVPNFATIAITNEELRRDYLEYLRDNGLHDLEITPAFPPSPREIRKFTIKTFEGDCSLRIEIDADCFEEMVEVGKPGSDNIRTITIRTANWKEV
jgi:nucleoid-associated protein YejK